MILAGQVRAGSDVIDKPGRLLDPEELLMVLEDPNPYVGRGGLKLQHALETFEIDPAGFTGLDVGASTGGFTDCLLQHGAVKVTAVDVGYNQLDYRLRQDERVQVLERVNARNLEAEDVGGRIFDIAVIDVSFISLKLILPRIFPLIKDQGHVLALVKPQFEVGKNEVEKKGVIRDPAKHYSAVVKVAACVEELRWGVSDLTISPISGQKGNREFFLHCQAEACGKLWGAGELWPKVHPETDIENLE